MLQTISLNDLENVSGGSFWESGAYQEGKLIDYYRCGVSYKNCAFSSDVYKIGSTKISKSTADKLVRQGTNLWKSKYQESGDFIAFAKEWKAILKKEYNIDWNGEMGKYSVGF